MLVQTRSDALVRTARLLTGSWQSAEDLVQVALLRTWQRWDRLLEPAAAEAYTRQIMARLSATWWRRRWHGEVPTRTVPDVHDPADVAHAAGVRTDLAAALAALPPRQRVTVDLAVLRGLERTTNRRRARVFDRHGQEQCGPRFGQATTDVWLSVISPRACPDDTRTPDYGGDLVTMDDDARRMRADLDAAIGPSPSTSDRMQALSARYAASRRNHAIVDRGCERGGRRRSGRRRNRGGGRPRPIGTAPQHADRNLSDAGAAVHDSHHQRSREFCFCAPTRGANSQPGRFARGTRDPRPFEFAEHDERDNQPAATAGNRRRRRWQAIAGHLRHRLRRRDPHRRARPFRRTDRIGSPRWLSAVQLTTVGHSAGLGADSRRLRLAAMVGAIG